MCAKTIWHKSHMNCGSRGRHCAWTTSRRRGLIHIFMPSVHWLSKTLSGSAFFVCYQCFQCFMFLKWQSWPPDHHHYSHLWLILFTSSSSSSARSQITWKLVRPNISSFVVRVSNFFKLLLKFFPVLPLQMFWKETLKSSLVTYIANCQ